VLTHRSIALAAKDARVIVATSSGRRLRADVLARDGEVDVALLKVDPGDQPLAAITIGTAEGLAPGRVVVALGNPFNVARDARASASLGVVQAIGKLDAREAVYQGDAILTDAGVNPGNEGGPLVDLDGRMIGLLAPIVRDRRSDALVSVAIPMDAIVPRLEMLAKGGAPGRMGILCSPADRDAKGLLVQRVVPGSPADKAGVREGDRVKSLDGEPIDSVAALLRGLENLHAGSTAKLVLERGGEDVKLDVHLGEGP
jgi:S1-C subfamily serine protease